MHGLAAVVAVAGAVVFARARRLFGAALWALHPVQVESVAWITELKKHAIGLFFVLAVWFFVKSKTRNVTKISRKRTAIIY